MQTPALLSFRRKPESSRRAGVLQRIPILSDCVMPAETRHGLSFPPGGNVFYKPLDSGFRRNDGKAVCQAFGKGQEQGCREDDRPIPTAGSRRGLPPRPLVPDAVYRLHPCRRRSMQAYSPVGESAQVVVRFPACFNISDLSAQAGWRHRLVIDFGATHPGVAGISDLIRVSYIHARISGHDNPVRHCDLPGPGG